MVGTIVQSCRRYREPVIVVDDGSGDATGLAAKRAGATVLTHAQNRGKGAALRTGFQWALAHGMDGVLTLDADGQHDPSEIPKLLSLADGADIVIGSRIEHKEVMPWSRYLTNRVMSIVVSGLAGRTIRDSQSGFRFLSSWAIRNLRLKTTRFDTESEMLISASRLGMRIREVAIRAIYGKEQSKIHVLAETARFVRLALSCIF